MTRSRNNYKCVNVYIVYSNALHGSVGNLKLCLLVTFNTFNVQINTCIIACKIANHRYQTESHPPF